MVDCLTHYVTLSRWVIYTDECTVSEDGFFIFNCDGNKYEKFGVNWRGAWTPGCP
jgi:hypothetical protein